MAFGADTTTFDPSTSSDRTPPSRPSESSISYADIPGAGSVSGSMPHTAAKCARAAGSSIFRYPGS